MFKKLLTKMKYTLPSGKIDWEEIKFDIIAISFLTLVIGGALYASN